jgi:hypothetical protein
MVLSCVSTKRELTSISTFIASEAIAIPATPSEKKQKTLADFRGSIYMFLFNGPYSPRFAKQNRGESGLLPMIIFVSHIQKLEIDTTVVVWQRVL